MYLKNMFKSVGFLQKDLGKRKQHRTLLSSWKQDCRRDTPQRLDAIEEFLLLVIKKNISRKDKEPRWSTWTGRHRETLCNAQSKIVLHWRAKVQLILDGVSTISIAFEEFFEVIFEKFLWYTRRDIVPDRKNVDWQKANFCLFPMHNDKQSEAKNLITDCVKNKSRRVQNTRTVSYWKLETWKTGAIGK